MAQMTEEKLLLALQKDDVKAYEALSGQTQLGGYRLGRFPVLSLMYLYKCRKLLAAYEGRLLKISNWEPLSEPACVAELFAKKAGKCLRLYFNEVVTPIEMLFVLDKIGRAKKIYPVVRPSEAVRGRLKSIYYIKYSVGVTFRGNALVPDRRPLGRREKKRLALACISCVLLLAIIVATPITVVKLVPKRTEWEVTKFEQIDFSSQKAYVLKKDIVIPDNFYTDRFNCSISGGGGRLIVGANSTLGELSGKLSNVQVSTHGSPLFTVCNKEGQISNVDIDVVADVISNNNSAFVTLINYGTIENVRVRASGRIYAYGKNASTSSGLIFGGIAYINHYTDVDEERIYGTISNCSVNFEEFTLKGEFAADAVFGGIVGGNNGVVQGCSASGEIVSDTFDIGGICAVNAYKMSDCVNDAKLSQTAQSAEWTPIVGGIAMENGGFIERCRNTGDLGATGVGEAVVGGIVGRSYGQCEYCLSEGNITASAESASLGGIFGIGMLITQYNYVYLGVADHCISRMNISADCQKTSYIGGVVGLVQEQLLDHYWGGGVTNCVFEGTIEAEVDRLGSIAGVVGANIYAQNSYESGSGTLHNFEGNLYKASETLSAFGGTVTAQDEDGETVQTFASAPDKGAASATADALRNSDLYKDILSKLGL